MKNKNLSDSLNSIRMRIRNNIFKMFFLHCNSFLFLKFDIFQFMIIIQVKQTFFCKFSIEIVSFLTFTEDSNRYTHK
jgi:hypothetical protein